MSGYAGILPAKVWRQARCLLTHSPFTAFVGERENRRAVPKP